VPHSNYRQHSAIESKVQPLTTVFCFFVCNRYFNVIGSDAKGRLGEAPRPELRAHGRISGACFDAAMGHIPGLKVCNVKVQYAQHPTSISTINSPHRLVKYSVFEVC
jgi:hypothetical protein